MVEYYRFSNVGVTSKGYDDSSLGQFSTRTIILSAIPLPIANLDPLTWSSLGPRKGADFKSVLIREIRGLIQR